MIRVATPFVLQWWHLLSLSNWPYHESMRQVTIGLRLEAHSVELSGNVALRTRRFQRGPPDFTQLGCNEKWQNALQKGNFQSQSHVAYFRHVWVLSIHSSGATGGSGVCSRTLWHGRNGWGSDRQPRSWKTTTLPLSHVAPKSQHEKHWLSIGSFNLFRDESIRMDVVVYVLTTKQSCRRSTWMMIPLLLYSACNPREKKSTNAYKTQYRWIHFHNIWYIESDKSIKNWTENDQWKSDTAFELWFDRLIKNNRNESGLDKTIGSFVTTFSGSHCKWFL